MKRAPCRLAALALALALVLTGACARPSPGRPAVPLLAGGTWGAWRTLRAVHRVSVTARTGEGHEERRTLRGVIAVERPARFRLRALGPGGITLFDLLYDDGASRVIESLRDPQGETVARLLSSITADLAATYDLRPRPHPSTGGRTLLLEAASVRIEERGRTVLLSDFRATPTGPAPARIAIETPTYHLSIEAEDTILNPLDPALFHPPPP